MSDARFSIDENVSRHLEPLLVARGHDVVGVRLLGTTGAKDYGQLATATRLNRILITHDEEDFRVLHGAWLAWFAEWGTPPTPLHGGILVIPQFPYLRVEDAADVIDQLMRSPAAEDGLANRLFAWTRESGWQEASG